MRTVKFLFLLMAICHFTASAQPLAPKTLPDRILFDAESATAANPLPPNPAHLAVNWWRFLDVKLDELPARIDTVVKELKNILPETPLTARAKAAQQVERIAENLQALAEWRNKEPPHALAAEPLQNSYSIKQWLEVDRKRRTLQAELQSQSDDLLSDLQAVNAQRQQVDSMTAAYVASSAQTQNKTLDGLALMEAWTEQALTNERLRLQNAALSVHKAYLQQLSETASAAVDRLSARTEDLPLIEREIATLTKDALAAHDKAARLADKIADEKPETEAGKPQALLSDQQLRLAEVEAAVADVAVAGKQIEAELTRLLSAQIKSQSQVLSTGFENAFDRIAEIGNQLDDWRETFERDQALAGKALAALAVPDEPKRPKLTTLAQQRLTSAQNALLELQRLEANVHDANLLAQRCRALVAQRAGALRTGLDRVKNTSAKVWNSIWSALSGSLFKIGDTPLTALGILRVLLIIFLAWLLSNFVRRGLTHLSRLQHGSSAFLYTLGRLLHYLILIIGISIGLSSIGVDLTNFALIAGALSLGIGFGLQAIVNNFVSGLIVLFERSLRIGDFVELSSGLAGEVKAINVRSTLVTTPDMVDVLVPNSEFVSGKVINWTLTDACRRIHIPFGVAYGSDKEVVRKAGLEAADQVVHTLKNHREREPEVWLTGFGDSSLEFSLVVWVLPYAVKKPQRVKAAYYWALETALKNNGIVIPFPQRDLHIRSGLFNPPATVEEDNDAQPDNQ